MRHLIVVRCINGYNLRLDLCCTTDNLEGHISFPDNVETRLPIVVIN